LTAAQDAEALQKADSDKVQRSTKLLRDFKRELLLAKKTSEVNVIQKKITPDVKKQMSSDDVQALKQAYLEAHERVKAEGEEFTDDLPPATPADNGSPAGSRASSSAPVPAEHAGLSAPPASEAGGDGGHPSPPADAATSPAAAVSPPAGAVQGERALADTLQASLVLEHRKHIESIPVNDVVSLRRAFDELDQHQEQLGPDYDTLKGDLITRISSAERAAAKSTSRGRK
jgi:hypothetical protein